MNQELERLDSAPPWEWPRNTAQTLLRILRDKQSPLDDRIKAASFASEITVINDEIASEVLKLVADPAEPEQLRAKAAIALGPALEYLDTDGDDDDFEEPLLSKPVVNRIGETFARLYRQAKDIPKLVRRSILEASVRCSQDWHAAAIREAYGSGDQDWRLTAVFCMRYVAGFDKQILESLGNPNPDIQREAVGAAGEFSVAAAWPRIEAILRNRRAQPGLLLAAIGAAGYVNAEEARPLLAEFAESSDEQIAEAAEEALMELDSIGFDDDEDDEEEDEPLF